MQEYTVYCHENKMNGKKYFGITSDITQRWCSEGKAYQRNPSCVFGRAIQKYGWDNFNHIIIFKGLTEEQAKQREVALIKYFQTNVCRYGDDYGYNMTDGGEGSSGYIPSAETRAKQSKALRGMPKSDEWRRKISEANTGKTHSQETRDKISKAHKGVKQSPETIARRAEALRGKVVSEETKARLREAHLGRKMSDEARAKMRDAAKNRGEEWKQKLSDSHKGKPAWNKGIPCPEDVKRRISETVSKQISGENNPNYGKPAKNRRAVICLEEKIIYPYIAIATLVHNAPAGNISRCCLGKRDTACGLHWRYATDDDITSGVYQLYDLENE